MPISLQKIKEHEINNILSSTKEDLEKLSDIELTTISDILTWRKKNKNINLYVIQNLLDAVHFLIMQESNRLKKEEVKNNNDQHDAKLLLLLEQQHITANQEKFKIAMEHLNKNGFLDKLMAYVTSKLDN